jgi:biopolymer transport protein ExbB/TolQ
MNEKILAAFIDPLNIPFLLGTAILFVVDFFTYYHDNGRNHRQLTGLMTAVGILGTFIGIVYALVDFNTHEIEKSIPRLLEGLKLAFVTSVTGLAAAIITEFVERLIPSKYAKVGDPVAEIIQKNSENLNDLLGSSIKTNENMAKEIGQLYKTVSYEMTETRSFLQNEFGGIRSDLDNALHKLAEGASEEIIKSLENVISRFNENLTQQFGENFKRLNEACLQLVKWQEDYKVTVETSSSAIQQTAEAMHATNERFDNLHAKMSDFDSGLTSMDAAIAGINNASQTILEALQTQDGLVTGFKRKIEETFEAVDISINRMDKGHEKWMLDSESRGKRAEESLKMSEEHSRRINEIQQNAFAETVKRFETVGLTNQKVVEGLQKASTEYENRLNKSLKSLEDSLISLTSDFGEHYRKFLDGVKSLMGKS